MSRLQPDAQITAPPPELVRAFSLAVTDDGRRWRVVRRVTDNHQRLVRLPLDLAARGVRLSIQRTWGAERGGVYAFYPDS